MSVKITGTALWKRKDKNLSNLDNETRSNFGSSDSRGQCSFFFLSVSQSSSSLRKFYCGFSWQCSAIQSTPLSICYSSKFLQAHSSVPAFCADLERQNIKSWITNHWGKRCQTGVQTANWVVVTHNVIYNSFFGVMLFKQLQNACLTICKMHFTYLATNDLSFTLEQHILVD